MSYLVTLLLSLSCFQEPSINADDILGTWLTEDGDTIEVYQCGDRYCGRIADIVEKVYETDDEMAGQTKVDRENPDPEKRAEPIMGLEIMKNFKFKPSGQWHKGTIYDPNNGKTYKCKVNLEGDTLRVRGYVGIPTLGRTALWTRK